MLCWQVWAIAPASTVNCSPPDLPGGSGYGIGMIGAWVYDSQHTESTEARAKAFFKRLVGPAFIVTRISKKEK